MVDIISPVIAVIMAYLLGSISFGLIIAREQKGIDIREFGSGNIGTTNVFRVVGKKFGLLTLLGDGLKGSVAVLLAQGLAGSAMAMALAGIAVVLGHIFPIFSHFRGGKGVATGLGVFLILMPWATLLAGAIWLTCCLFWRYVSAASMTAALSLPMLGFLLGAGNIFVIVGIIIGLLIIWRHSDNLERLWQGTESKIGSRKVTYSE
jgi:glycerol-3-phosphate acyltransferase PlsY